MTSPTPEAAVPGTSFRPLPPPILEASSAPESPVAATPLEAPELVIVPASDLPATSPVLPERVASRQRAAAWMRAHGREADALASENEPSATAWLRTDPPPILVPTTWLRVVLVMLLCGAMGSALWFRYTSDSGDAADAQLVVGLHAGVIGALIVWSFVSMRNANALVPATRYQSRSRGWVVASLWLLACSAPVGAVVASDAARELFDDPDHPNVVIVQIALVIIVAAIVGLPFRYLAMQAARIGARRRVMFQWFLLPTVAAAGGFSIMALGLRDDLAAGGVTDNERLIEACVVYGLPMLLFALNSWRATSAFDAVIDIRWRRWKTGFDQSEAAFGAADAKN